MAATYDSLRALSRQTMKKLLDVQEWRKFLAFASRSFKLPFPAQVLAYAQRPDAAALMKSSDWEAVYGRPVKKGCHGVPVPEGRGKKLVYYYDIADTRETDESRPVPLWHVWPENQKGIGKALESYLGKLEDASGFAETLLAAARKTVACTLDDRLDDLAAHSPGSLLEELDSDKKVLYARLDGRIVGRAFLRLTKCRRTSAGGGSLTFVDLEAGGTGQQEREQMTLFLERPYISGLGPEAKTQAAQALVELAKRKAEELGILLVLSQDYADYSPQGFTQTRLHIFISKSKGGAQYLDSLDGEAAVSKEGSYQANRFLIQS